MQDKQTSIRVHESTRIALNEKKAHPRNSAEDTLRFLLGLGPIINAGKQRSKKKKNGLRKELAK